MPRVRDKALVWIFRPGGGAGPEVLVLRRPERRGGGWHPVTGKAEAGEAPALAAQREAEEETGITGELVDLRFRHEFNTSRGRFVEHAWLLVAERNSPFALSDEHVAGRWISAADAGAAVEWDSHKASLVLAQQAWSERTAARRSGS